MMPAMCRRSGCEHQLPCSAIVVSHFFRVVGLVASTHAKKAFANWLDADKRQDVSREAA